MLVSRHVILTGIFAVILYPFIGFYSLIVFFSGFLFDIDHYFYYVVKKKDLSLRNGYFYSLPGSKTHEPPVDVFHAFHTSEFWILLLILTYVIHEVFLFVFVGLMFHMLLDIIDGVVKNELHCRAWSIIGWILRN